MIAEVLPRLRLVRTLSTFQYRVPQDLRVQVGDLVLIPWRTKFLLGVILRVGVRSSRIPQKKLRPILCRVSNCAFSRVYLNTLLWFANYYAISPAHALSTWLPEVSKQYLTSERPQMVYSAGLDKSMNRVQTVSHDDGFFETIAADISQKTQHPQTILISSFSQKVDLYHALLRPVRGKVLILAPTITDVEKLCEALAVWRPLPYHSGLSNHKLWESFWLYRYDPHTRLLIGTKRALFTFPDDLSLLIIDQEESPHHKQYDQNPRYAAHPLALHIFRHSSARVIFTTHAPRAATLFHTDFLPLSPVRSNALLQITDTNLLPGKNFSRLLNEMLATFVSSKHPAFIFQNRTGLARYLLCPMCQSIYAFGSVVRCAKCHNTHLTTAGFGTQKVLQNIERLLPNKHIVIFDRFHTKLPKTNTTVVGTEFAFEKLDFSRFQGFAIIGFDRQLALPSWRAHERAFQILSFFLSFGKPVFLPTFAPKHVVIQSLLTGDMQQFYEQELRLRRTFGYPPFAKLVKVMHRKSGKVEFLKSPSRQWQPPSDTIIDVDPDTFSL